MKKVRRRAQGKLGRAQLPHDWNKIISLEQIIKKNIAAKINFFSVDSDLNLKNEKMFLLEQIVPLDKNEKIFY